VALLSPPVMPRCCSKLSRCFILGLGLVILGTGLFKPNISAIVGQLYNKENEHLRDSGYTLFYMGVNSGAFFGILLCGYIGEKFPGLMASVWLVCS
jgi:dipeptide/tripeptide permease